MKTLFAFAGTLLMTLAGVQFQNENQNEANQNLEIPEISKTEETKAETKIQVALLLDTSNSMDGLIDQAKSRLWNIVNTLTTLRYKGKMPEIEISLYEYGNDGLSAEKGYIRQVTPLTSDLDLISEKLFSLRTNGGSEFCGQAIDVSLKELNWDNNKKSMKLIYIAGNEPFDQGEVNYKESISNAVNKEIFVNTIHCGDEQTGIAEFWKDGADKGNGEYFFIDQNQKVIYISTPYDVKIDDLNTRLNGTYIYYGTQGEIYQQRQVQQDMMAESVSYENKAARSEAKANANYNNSNWDLIDAVNENEVNLEDLDKSTLPERFQDMTTSELENEVEKLNGERAEIQKEILDLSVKREEFIQTELAKTGESETDLGKAITDAVLKFANAKGYTQEK